MSAYQAPSDALSRSDRTARDKAGRGDVLFRAAALGAALLVLIALAGTMLAMFLGGLPAFRAFGLRFLYGLNWDPVARQFAAGVAIYGTLVSSLIAMIVAVPVSFGIAVFLNEVAPSGLRDAIAGAIELLAGIPSIIYGMWGLFVFAPFMSTWIDPWINTNLGVIPGLGALFRGPPLGIGMLTAGIILGIMVIPFISSVMRDAFALVPKPLREAAFAVGATRWEVARRVVLPYTGAAVTGGIFLGLGRALGETMAVTFVLGNAHDLHLSLLMPGTSISATIANEFTEADSPLYVSSLIALGLLLFVITFVVLCAGKLLLLRAARQQPQS